MTLGKIIAIDGPASSGKSTLGRNLAAQLGYLYFDTGVMYRAVAWAALASGIDVHDEERVTQVANQAQIDVLPPSALDGRDCDVLVDGQDVTWKIRSSEVNMVVSIVSAYAGVRQALTIQQRRVGLRGAVVMVGRDIGTVVLPEADLKIYLDASAEVRARRRYDEYMSRGEKVVFQDVLESIQERDRIDTTRAVAPLKPAEDAIYMDSNELDVEAVLQKTLGLIKTTTE